MAGASVPDDRAYGSRQTRITRGTLSRVDRVRQLREELWGYVYDANNDPKDPCYDIEWCETKEEAEEGAEAGESTGEVIHIPAEM